MKLPDDLPHLQQGEAIGAGLGGVVLDCGTRAAGAARRPGEAEVHGARQALKRMRAVLRLGEELGVAGAKTARRRLARLARELSRLRDGVVMAKVARRLAKDGDEAERRAVAALEDNGPSATDVRMWTAWKKKLRAERPRLARLPWGEPTLDDIEEALQRGAQRVARRAKAARKSHEMMAAHEWRKAVIVLREQVAVVAVGLGARAERWHAELQALSHRLGQATDCAVFITHVEGRSWPTNLRPGLRRLVRKGRKKRRQALKRARERWAKGAKDLGKKLKI